jgi:putative protease
MIKNQKSELLLPVGNMNMCLAAIHNGADAIYVGMPFFNARGRTNDLSISELDEMIKLCHLYGVKVNLAFNVVIFENELKDVVDLLNQTLALSPDAIIVQDLGLARIIREMAPHQMIHASTQMTVTNHEAIALLNDLSIKRFVLGREVSLSEIKQIKENTDRELEVFVHGALCVAYSGQCFTSESIGGRSANRGQCAQSCRFEYDLIVDGVKKNLLDKKYLVSPKDLCGIAEIPQLLDLGIDSFKVEGRLKTPEYVAAAAKNYRNAIDIVVNEKKFTNDDIANAQFEMGLTYSRGFFSGWLNGVDHQKLVGATYGSHRGVEIGEVIQVKNQSIIIKSDQILKNGDGILFAGHRVNKKFESGGHLYKVVELSKHTFELSMPRTFVIKDVHAGDLVYLNHDAKVESLLTKSFTDKNYKKRISINILVFSKFDEPLKIIVSDGFNEINLETDLCVEKAHGKPVTLDNLKEELGALGSTCFILSKLSLHGDQDFFIHHKEIKKLRQRFCNLLIGARTLKKSQIYPLDLSKLRQNIPALSNSKPNLNILLRDFSQVQSFINFAVDFRDHFGVIFLDFEYGKNYSESAQLLKLANFKVGIATTRILKPNEYYNFKVIERSNPDIILIRNLGALNYFKDKSFELRGDFSLNATNSLTVDYLLSKNLSTICASYDLDYNQLCDLLHNTNPSFIEVTIHQYMPSFHMEHCVFAAFLSTGSSFRDCGKPCEKHRVELKDQFGHFHHIKADQECRNTMFNATSQSAGSLIPEMIKMGVRNFRFEALYENEEELKQKILTYLKLMDQSSTEIDFNLINKLGAMEKYGLSDKLSMTKSHKNRKTSH